MFNVLILTFYIKEHRFRNLRENHIYVYAHIYTHICISVFIKTYVHIYKEVVKWLPNVIFYVQDRI